MSKEKLIQLLDREEPDYKAAAELGPEIIPVLLDLTKSGDPKIAPRAIYTAGLLQDANAIEILKEGASSDLADIRVAAAATLRKVTGMGDSDLLNTLLNDSDPGVRKVASKGL
ncbi:HEAT repeat domain-containing protein [Paenibacillus sp. SC116]|uniref:HEAT repeat domain-containing protein n=1 Tax=Paenibacillus sp. SC116 TaxID=2968986 RepID=UPI00215A25AD|nr:HEAT repeat domain-containing protein [Paenibacillus sp. SC116]MCR8844322.1 HEAT repeat domain-containing protein [Paenibacillus sp. SC116]